MMKKTEGSSPYPGSSWFLGENKEAIPSLHPSHLVIFCFHLLHQGIWMLPSLLVGEFLLLLFCWMFFLPWNNRMPARLGFLLSWLPSLLCSPLLDHSIYSQDLYYSTHINNSQVWIPSLTSHLSSRPASLSIPWQPETLNLTCSNLILPLTFHVLQFIFLCLGKISHLPKVEDWK